MNVLLPHSADLLSRIRSDIDEALKQRGVSARQVSIDIAGHDGVIRDIRAGKMPGVDRVDALYRYLGLEFYIGPRRVEEREEAPFPETDFVLVPLYEAVLAAGAGSHNGDNEPVSELAFHRKWLRALGVQFDKICVARAIGDSMMPMIHPGDMLLLDLTRTTVPIRRSVPNDAQRAPIYALLDDGGARVKRIARPDRDTMILFSDNQHHPAELLSGERAAALAPTIIGQVRWSGHTIQD